MKFEVFIFGMILVLSQNFVSAQSYEEPLVPPTNYEFEETLAQFMVVACESVQVQSRKITVRTEQVAFNQFDAIYTLNLKTDLGEILMTALHSAEGYWSIVEGSNSSDKICDFSKVPYKRNQAH